MTAMGISRLTVAKILNHKESGVTSVYDRYSYGPEIQCALDDWSVRLQEILSSETPPPGDETAKESPVLTHFVTGLKVDAGRQEILEYLLKLWPDAPDENRALLNNKSDGDLKNFYLQFINSALLDDIRRGAETDQAAIDERSRIIDALVSLSTSGFVTGYEPEPTPSANPDLKDYLIRSARARRAHFEGMSTEDLRIQCREMLQHQEEIHAFRAEFRAAESDKARKRARKRHDRASPIQAFANDARLRGLSANDALRELEKNAFAMDGMVVVVLKDPNKLSKDRIVVCRDEAWGKGTKSEEIGAIRALVQTRRVPFISRRTFENRFWPKAKP